MSNIEITANLTDNYSIQFKKIETYIHDLGVILNQKNLDDLKWVLPRTETFKTIYHDDFINDIVEELKAKKMGKSINEICLYISSCYILQKVENLIKNEIVEKHFLTLDDWVENKIDMDLNNKSDIYYNLNKFTIWSLLEVQSLMLVWDKKDIAAFPISEFFQYQTMTYSKMFKHEQDVLNYINTNKDRSRINIFKLLFISIESNLKSAKYYLKELS